MLPGFRNIIAIWKVPRLRPFGLLVRDVHSTLVEWYIQGKTDRNLSQCRSVNYKTHVH